MQCGILTQVHGQQQAGASATTAAVALNARSRLAMVRASTSLTGSVRQVND
jgi:hypothetical protein